MTRPSLQRRLGQSPQVTFYKPQGVPLRSLEFVDISHEEWEALRLKNVKGLDQTQAAEKMKTSQSTFQRILSEAYRKISEALVNGKAIRIQKQ
ncbi:DUF134 domain-containing protein [Patescibacteria group bacterium]|nr:DUF134 domain-containing protein [Patescibacteria group bacterium]